MQISQHPIFLVNDIMVDKILEKVYFECDISVSKARKKYYNIVSAFDIETTNFRDDENCKCAVMYVWQFLIDRYVIIGRTWEEFCTLYNKITRLFCDGMDVRFVVYVHNLSMEFQFVRKWLEISEIMANSERKPIYAITKQGVEFRCSYILSGYSLDYVAKNLKYHKIEKLTAQFDYDKMRNRYTILSEPEMEYIVNDVIIIQYYIEECIDECGSIANIPYTKTGYVRRFCRKNCLADDNYRRIIKDLTIADIGEYEQLKRAFCGGYTHANAYAVSSEGMNKVFDNVVSYDFNSAYPFCMVAEQYPMSKAYRIDITSWRQFDDAIKKFCCVFDMVFYKIDAKFFGDHYISASKCVYLRNPVIDNGRLVSADEIGITLTDIDYKIIDKTYKYRKKSVANFKYYYRGYLPTPFVKSVLDLYKKKTELKGVEGKEVEYMRSKEMVNSCYGMMVTDIVRPEIIYKNDEWCVKSEDKAEKLKKHNYDKKRFLYYPWGIYVTAHCRKNLWCAIYHCNADYLYSDTDSIKIQNGDQHREFFETYNADVVKKLKRACDYHHFDFDMVAPKTVTGKVKILGIFDMDGQYDKFKTLGAKRYAYIAGDELHITVAGLGKNAGVRTLIKYGKTPEGGLKKFCQNLYISEDDSDKLTHTYIDYAIDGTITDYQGHTCDFYEKSCLHLEKTSFELSYSEKFIAWLKYIGGVTIEQ